MIDFPCLTPQWVPTHQVVANDYNPNAFARPELELLKLSIQEDGLTQPVVVYHDQDNDRYIVIDGFHRFSLLRDHFGCSHIPVVVLDRSEADRMVSTVCHNRARGQHSTALTEAMVRTLKQMGWKDTKIARHLGMRPEAVLRLQQQRGIADYYAHRSYSRAWVWQEDAPDE